MILSRNWLTKYLNLEKINNSQISEALNSLGFEVEQEIDYDKLNDKLVIGYVEESVPIPETHLSLNKVNVGSKKLSIVCGAENVSVNQYVVVGQVGQTIANGLTLASKKIQGYQSEGMICALNEIGFANQVLNATETRSIYVIQSFADLHPLIGHSIKEVGFGDYLWDLDLTLNRSDALAAFQLVKELANYFHLKIKDHNFDFSSKFKQIKNSLPKITVEVEINKSLKTMAIESLVIKPNDQQINTQEDLLLKTLGMKTSSVKIEDLAMISSWETGQPLIVFDENKIKENLKITWSEVEGKKVVVLKDGDEIVQVIGLPTTSAYQITNQTTKVLVLALSFESGIMRSQQKQLAVSNLALQRYMKPLSTQIYLDGFNSFNQWLKEYQIFEKVAESEIIKESEKQNLNFPVTLTQIQNLLGVNLTVEEIKSLFQTLDFEIQSQKENLIFKIDSHRTDIVGVNDICEEIARLYGYDKIVPLPPTLIASPAKQNLKLQLQDKMSNYLVGLGFKNTKTYSLINEQKAEYWNLFNLNKPVKLLSPLSQLHETYRLSLVPSFIEATSYNVANDNKQFKFWEIADIYTQNTRQRHLAILTTGRLINEPILHQVLENNYFYLKGVIEAIFNLYKVNLNDVTFNLVKNPLSEVHPFINAEIKIKKQIVGFIFRFNPKFENDQKLPPTCYAELNLDVISEMMNRDYQINPVSKFQSSTRDLSLIVPSSLGYEKLIAQILKNVHQVTDSKIIDQYQDESMKKKNEQSLTISFTFNDLTKQMTEAEINQQWNQILKNVEKLGLVVR